MEERFRPRKSLGQNFLVDDNIARKIVRMLNLQAGDVVVEIGPGRGALTKHLLECGRTVTAVEVDRRAAEFLNGKFKTEIENGQLCLEREDFLAVDLENISKKFSRSLRVVGNIPYYITTPILFKVIEQRQVVEDLTMLVQLEVGKRIVAKPGTKDYGILSVFSQFYGKPKLLFKVPATAFIPKPKVTSVLLWLDFSGGQTVKVQDEKIFVAVVRTTFGKRRKTLRNGLKYLPLERFNPAALNFDLDLRPEQLSVLQFAELADMIAESWHSHKENQN